MSDVFISYSRKDIAFARLIQESLQQSQIDTWIDWERIPVGEKWWDEICQAIENANVFMFIISKNSIGSSVCKDEINHALKNHKRIIPIIVDNLKPEAIKEFAPDLPQFNWIIFERDQLFRIEENPEVRSDKPEDSQVALPLPPQFEEALGKLGKAIHTDWEWVKYHTRLQVDALRWESNARNPGYLVRGAALEESEQQLLRATGKDPQPTGLQVEYVTASRKEETLRQNEKLRLEQKARQRQRLVIWAVGIGLAAAMVLGGLAWGQRNQYLGETHVRATAQAVAEEQRNMAATAQAVAEEQRNVAVSRQLAAQAINQIENKDLSLGLLLSLEAYQHADTMDARSSLLRLIQTEPQLRYFINGHADTVWSVAISPDGKTIASASGDATIGLWDMVTGNPVHPALMGHTRGVQAVAFSPDGRYLASGAEDGQVLLWNVNQDFSSEILFSKSDVWVYKLAFSPDGKYLAASFTDRSVVIWTMVDRSIACPFINGRSESQEFTALAFSPDGKNLAVGNDNGELTIWNPATCQQKGESIDTARLAKISGVGASGEVTSLAYSPDGTQLAIGEGDHLLVLDATTRQPLRDSTVIHSNYRIQSIAYSPDSRSMALGMDDKTIVLLDSATGQPIGQPLFGQRSAIRSVAFSSDGHSLVSGGWDASVLVWDLQNQPLSRTLIGHTDTVWSVVFSPNGKLLASAGNDQTIRLWDTTTWQTIGQPLIDHEGDGNALAFSPDSRILASGGTDQLIHLWDVDTGKPLGEPLAEQGDEIRCLAFSPDGKWLAAGGKNNRLTIWELATRTLYRDFQFSLPMSVDPLDIDIHKTIRSIGFSPDSATLYLSMGGGITKFIDMAGLESGNGSVRQLKWTQLSALNYIFAKMSLDGKTMALANTLDIRLYDTASLQMVGLPMYGHTDLVTGLAFTPDGSLLASSSQDATVRLWDPATAQPVGLPLTGHSLWISSLDISPDGRWLASASADQTARVWDISVQDWQSLACQLVRRNLNGPEWQQYLPDEAYHLTCPGQLISQSGVALISALARTRLDEGKSEEAKAIIQEGLDWILPLQDDVTNNTLCWFGSLDGFAAEVMPACERAVSLAPVSLMAGNRDSRGVALALTGKTDEAIADFQALVDWCKQNGCSDTLGRQREEWIAALKRGQNPFDEQLLQSLRNP
jgi:WD40 repeat protein